MLARAGAVFLVFVLIVNLSYSIVKSLELSYITDVNANVNQVYISEEDLMAENDFFSFLSFMKIFVFNLITGNYLLFRDLVRFQPLAFALSTLVYFNYIFFVYSLFFKQDSP